jgi:Spy/CpxP family protein refolding chaperone
MPPDSDTIDRASLANLTSREINALLNTRTAVQRRSIRSQLTPRQRGQLKQWQREHRSSASSDQSLTGMLLLGVVVVVVIAFVGLILITLLHRIK